MKSRVLPLFSGGTGRSGTTIVGKLLSRHPEVRGGRPYEVRFIHESFGLLDLCYGIERFESSWKRWASSLYIGLISPRKRKFFFDKFETHMRGKWWERTNRLNESTGLHRSITRSSLDEMIEILRIQFPRDHIQASRNFFHDFLERQKHNHGEKFWIDTSPLNISSADRIYLLLPEAKFIHMKRDGRDTIASVLKENWGPKSPKAALRWWEGRMFDSLLSLRAIPRDQVLELNLEDLVVNNRRESYSRLLDFVGIEDNQSMHEYFDKEMPSERLRIGKYRDEIPDWQELDKAYLASLERLKPLLY